MKEKKTVSEEEIQKALQKFQHEGGLIKKLPDQIVPRSTMVGSKWAMFEAVGEQGVTAESG